MAEESGRLDEIFKRLNETEAQTREQNVAIKATNERISALCERVSKACEMSEKFFEIEERRLVRVEALFGKVCEDAEKRFAAITKILYFTVAMLGAAALGPKAIEKLTPLVNESPLKASLVQPDIIPMGEHQHAIVCGDFRIAV